MSMAAAQAAHMAARTIRALWYMVASCGNSVTACSGVRRGEDERTGRMWQVGDGLAKFLK
jgi:hypothetical protein